MSDTEEFGETYHYHLTYDSPNLPACRVGAAAVGTLSSPDNAERLAARRRRSGRRRPAAR